MAKKLNSPIRYLGGKGRFRKQLLPLLPPSRTYVEVFGGGGVILLSRDPSPVEVYNDADSILADFFRVLSDPALFKQFMRRAAPLPMSRELTYEYRITWRDEPDLVKRVVQWFHTMHGAFCGHQHGGWALSVSTSARGMASTCAGWLSALDRLPEIHARLQQVQIENLDFRQCIKTYDSEETLFYLDPPYVPETRSRGGYDNEMTEEDHAEMVEILLAIKGDAVLSGYAHPVYEPLEKAGWERVDISTFCNATGRTKSAGLQKKKGVMLEKQKRIESIWVSPSDYDRGTFHHLIRGTKK